MLIFRSALGLAILSISSAYATTEPAIERILVVGKALNSPSMVAIDPKQPRQPIPAHDGADFLKTIPGFSVTRKGGTDGDVLFRGMAGSRLGILLDGENILGACDMRMDSPTAYIYPELHDNVIVIKGPQAVRYGAGHSAATIVFERDLQRFTEPSYRFHLSTVNASFNRNDQLVDLTLGNSLGYLRLNGSRSEEHTSELQSRPHLVCRLLLEKKKTKRSGRRRRPRPRRHDSTMPNRGCPPLRATLHSPRRRSRTPSPRPHLPLLTRPRAAHSL